MADNVSERSGRLLVYVGGLTEKLGSTDELFARLRSEPGHAGDEVWVYPDWVRPTTRGALAALAESLSDRTESMWTDRGCPSEIVLIGHSAGGVLVRYAYLIGVGRLGHRRAGWADRVSRIVLLAAPNRGVALSRLPLRARLVSAIASVVARNFAALELLAGSAFMTDLRLEWIRLFAELGSRAPIVVQVRGAADPVIKREDSRDIESQQTGTDLYLPQATHADIVRIARVREDTEGQRYRILRHAIQEDVEPTQPEPLPEAEGEVTEVVFLLHGIRAGIDTWVADLKRILTVGSRKILVIGSSYGRLSAYNFALPLTRRRTLRWFQDQYSYHAVRHPQAAIHFVGHSNGTYMFGQSIHKVRTLRFDKVLLAGSVLPRDFDWTTLDHRHQVGALVNVCATKDKPVGWLCSGLRGLGMRDIGVGGFTGFDVTPPSAVQLLNLDGGHGAGLTTERLPAVAEYLRTGTPPGGPTAMPSVFFGQISRLAPYLFWLLLVGVFGAVAWAVIGFSAVKLAIVLGTLLLIYLLLKVA